MGMLRSQGQCMDLGWEQRPYLSKSLAFFLQSHFYQWTLRLGNYWVLGDLVISWYLPSNWVSAFLCFPIWPKTEEIWDLGPKPLTSLLCLWIRLTGPLRSNLTDGEKAKAEAKWMARDIIRLGQEEGIRSGLSWHLSSLLIEMFWELCVVNNSLWHERRQGGLKAGYPAVMFLVADVYMSWPSEGTFWDPLPAEAVIPVGFS